MFSWCVVFGDLCDIGIGYVQYVQVVGGGLYCGVGIVLQIFYVGAFELVGGIQCQQVFFLCGDEIWCVQLGNWLVFVYLCIFEQEDLVQLFGYVC